MEGERTVLSPVLRPVERAVYRVCGIDETAEQGWKGYAVGAARCSASWRILAMYVDAAAPGRPAAEPERQRRPCRRSWPSTRRSASRPTRTGRTTPARRRQPPHPGGRPRRAQLHVGGRGHRHRRRPHPRPRPAQRSSTIGNFWVDLTRATLYILLPIAVVGAIVLVWQGVTQTFDGTADRRRRSQGARADHRPRAARLAGVHQGAGHQRRRALQRQLGAPVREPQRAHQLDRDVRHPASSRSA